jgi:hypothetical protein
MSLDAAHVAFAAGNFAEARSLAKQLVASAPDEATRSAAQDILRRTGLDPLIIYLTAACALVFIAIVVATALGH